MTKKNECMKTIYFICACILSFNPIFGQIGVGTTQPNSSSILDVYSTTKGVLFPQMTTTNRNSIHLPAEGLLIFNIDSQYYQINQGSELNPHWERLETSGYEYSSTVVTSCNLSFFSGVYNSGVPFTSANTFTLRVANQGFIDVEF